MKVLTAALACLIILLTFLHNDGEFGSNALMSTQGLSLFTVKKEKGVSKIITRMIFISAVLLCSILFFGF